MTDQLIAMLSQFGAAGPLLAYLIWDRNQRNKLDAERTKADIEMAKAMVLWAERLDV